MAWEQYNNQTYYYQARHEKGRIRKVYFGRGVVGELAADLDAADRLYDELRFAERSILQASDLPVTELCEMARLAVDAALLGAGYYLHLRAWRKRRDRSKSKKRSQPAGR